MRLFQIVLLVALSITLTSCSKEEAEKLSLNVRRDLGETLPTGEETPVRAASHCSGYARTMRLSQTYYPNGVLIRPNANTLVDLRRVLVEGQRNASQPTVGKIKDFDNICISGGSFIGKQDPQIVPWVYGHATYTAGINFSDGQGPIVVENVDVRNSLQDGINLAGDLPNNVTFTLRGSRISNNSDDGIQDDSCKKINLIEDTLIESKVILSMRPGADSVAAPGSCGNYKIPIRRSLFNVICVADDRPDGSDIRNPILARNNNCGSNKAAAMVFKMSPAASHVGIDMSDTIIRYEAKSRNGWRSMSFPRGTYRNVVVVWDPVKPGLRYEGPALPPGVTMTTDRSVWTRARNAWMANHPDLRD